MLVFLTTEAGSKDAIRYQKIVEMLNCVRAVQFEP